MFVIFYVELYFYIFVEANKKQSVILTYTYMIYT